MIGGTYGKILNVDLTSGKIHVENPPDEFYRLLLGGRGMIAYYLLRDLPAGADPLSPDNLLVFAPGVLQGTNIPGSGRHNVGGKSPLTGAIGSSESGGWWGNEFKRSGFDALVVRGKAEKPVYLWIKDGVVEIRPAGHLWGLKTGPAQDAIRAELGDQRIRVAQIGPAGENLVRYAAVMHDANRASGRNGMGAVMGSKNLKAVAVRGTLRLPVADAERVGAVTQWLRDNYKTLAAWAVPGSGRGTQDSLTSLNHVGGLPTRNFNDAVFEEAELLSGERNYEMYLKERDTCHACPISCKSTFQNESDDAYKQLDPVYGGAEYEAMGAFGPVCDVSDNLAVLKANELCNAYGLDAISTGVCIGFVMECFENGLITPADTGGLAYRWGDGNLMVRTVEMIAERSGFGDVVAEGVERMSKRFGPETQPFNMTVKGQELPMHEPRLKYGLGVGYALSPVGADHMMNMHDTMYAGDGRSIKRVNTALDEPIAPVPANVLNEDKMKIFYNEVNFRHLLDCALVCHFYPYDYKQLADLVSGVSGEEYGIRDMITAGARTNTLARLFNLREGFTEQDDRIPRRVMKAFTEGPIAGNEITEENFEWAKQRFYEMMGWDVQTGVPTEECLQQLGITDLLPGL
jgi:aldehyde:ferredoxin oxidoreductase